MTDPKYTPGPWETSVLSDGTGWEVCEAGGGDAIAAFVGPNAEANAFLAGAAPELLGALKTTSRLLAAAALVITHAESRAHAIKVAREADALIAKATGSTSHG